MMIVAICSKFQHIKPRVSSSSYRCLFSTSSVNPILGSTSPTDSESFTLSFLVNSCGLSLDSAVSASKKLRIEITDQPHLVLKLLKSHGLTQTHINDVITKRPLILQADPSQTLQPNIELLDSVGISGTNLQKILQKVPRILESRNVISVVEFFNTHGFSNKQITNMMLKLPDLFTFNPQKTLKLKLEFLQSLGFPVPELAKLISSSPYILHNSLEKRIIPCARVLKSTLRTDENVMKAIRGNYSLFQYNLEKAFLPNFLTLTKFGVSESNVLKLILELGKTRALLQSRERFRELVEKVIKLGLDPKRLQFVLALDSLVMGKSKWEKKIETLGSFGISGDEFHLAFKLQPMFMLLSEKKLREKLEYFVKVLKFHPSTICRHPNIFLFSLEKRIIPRCSVVQLLISNALYRGNMSLITVFVLTERKFVQNFVTKFEHTVPEVVKAHQGEIEFKGFNGHQLLQLVSDNAPCS